VLPVTTETVVDSFAPETSFVDIVVPPVTFFTVAVLSVVPGISANPDTTHVRVSPAVKYEPVTEQPAAIEAAFQVTPTGRVWAKVTSPPPGTELHAQR
jgi:hypothetical protein